LTTSFGSIADEDDDDDDEEDDEEGATLLKLLPLLLVLIRVDSARVLDWAGASGDC
jgi:hypothetical protein